MIDDEKLGKGKDKVDTLSNLLEIFEKSELDVARREEVTHDGPPE